MTVHPDDLGQIALREAMKVLRENKPTERNELARRYAVTITELEKVISYYDTFIVRRDLWVEE